MPDLLGYGDAPNAVTDRPDDTRVFGAVDTWAKDCSSPGSNDGTFLGQAFMNGLLAQVRRAIRGMSITEDNTDDDMLLKAIQASANSSVAMLDARTYNPVFPQATAANGLIGVTGSTGEVVVSAGQTFVHRGVFPVKTDDYSLANRTFVTAANKTYHLRWRWNAGAPAFSLQDLADVVYNSTSAAETDPKFDTSYDDMLVARVVTNGSNSPTITTLVNKDKLTAKLVGNQQVARALNWTALPGGTLTMNWARTPAFAQPMLQGFSGRNASPDGSDVDNPGGFPSMMMLRVASAGTGTRYSASLEYAYDDEFDNNGQLQFGILATA